MSITVIPKSVTYGIDKTSDTKENSSNETLIKLKQTLNVVTQQLGDVNKRMNECWDRHIEDQILIKELDRENENLQESLLFEMEKSKNLEKELHLSQGTHEHLNKKNYPQIAQIKELSDKVETLIEENKNLKFSTSYLKNRNETLIKKMYGKIKIRRNSI